MGVPERAQAVRWTEMEQECTYPGLYFGTWSRAIEIIARNGHPYEEGAKKSKNCRLLVGLADPSR
jgi:hypothetical protein